MIYYDELKYVISKLPVPNGWQAGQPMQLQSWQDKLLHDCFSTDHRPEIVYVEIPRKNGKTTFTAGILDGMLSADTEMGAEFYCCSGDKEQAGIVFNIASYMVNNTAALSKRIRVVPSTKKLVLKDEPNKFFRSLSNDAHSKHGYNPYFTIFDELHVFNNRDLWDVMDTGDLAREKPMKFVITTAGNDMSTLCGEMHEHALDVLSGKSKDLSFKPYIFTVSDPDKWDQEEEWFKANPSLGSVLKIERMRAKFDRAKGRPTSEAAFKRLHLNIWQESRYQWISIEKFRKMLTTVEDSKLHAGIGGLDLGFGSDTTSFTIYKNSVFRTWIWMTDSEASYQEKMHGVKWTQWMREGHVRRYGQDVADYDVLERDLLDIIKTYGVKKVAFDRWKSHHLINKIARRVETIPVGQGFASMTMPVKHIEGLINANKLVGHHNPAVIEAFKKVYIKQDAAGNAKPDKQKSWHKIDPVVSLLTAVAVAEQEVKKRSVYEDRGLL